MALSLQEYTPLHLAARYNKPLAVVALLKASANINAKDKLGRTPLMLASKYGSKNSAEEILKNRGNMTETDERG